MNPDWSIIIPVKPGGKVRAIQALGRITYPHELIEVLITEGSQPSRQRNRAVEQSTGELLYFLDDDSFIAPDALSTASAHYSDPAVAAVGGPSLTPASDSHLQQAFGATLGSLIGGGKVRNRYRATGTVRKTGEHELILCNLSFRRKVFVECGGLDERLYPNEENELMDRINRQGWKLIHDPGMGVLRSQRKSYHDFVRQLFTYGRGRGEQTRLSRRINLASFLPMIFLAYLLLLPALVLHNPVYTLPLLCYAGTVVITALWEAASQHKPSLFAMLLTIPTLHIAYGAGMALGLVSPRYRDDRNQPPEIVVRRIEIDE